MAGKEPSARPRAPHLQVYKWGPAMAVSILHRVSGDGLAIVGAGMFLWWLGALAAGPDAYAAFVACVWHDPSPEVTLLHQITNVLGLSLIHISMCIRDRSSNFTSIRSIIVRPSSNTRQNRARLSRKRDGYASTSRG